MNYVAKNVPVYSVPLRYPCFPIPILQLIYTMK